MLTFWILIAVVFIAMVFVISRSMKIFNEKRQVMLYSEDNMFRIQNIVNKIALCETFDEVIELRGKGFDVADAMYEDIKALCPSDPLYVLGVKNGYTEMILQAAKLKFAQFQRFNELESQYWQYLK